MSDAPEKIWAMASIHAKWSDAHATNYQPYVNDITAPFIFEYTRSDIAQARIDKLEAQAVGFRESIRKALMDSEYGNTILDICWEAHFPQEEVEDG
jgi:hypothetical protein